MNILISAASTMHAYRLHRFLQPAEQVFFADAVDLPQLSTRGGSFLKIPSTTSPAFSHLLLASCLDLSITVVYPLRWQEVVLLCEARQLFDEYGIKLIIPKKAELDTFLSKRTSKGTIQIIDREVGSPDRGVFVIDQESSELSLFTAD